MAIEHTPSNDRNWQTIRAWLDERDEKIRQQSDRIQSLEQRLAMLERDLKKAQVDSMLAGRDSGSTT